VASGVPAVPPGALLGSYAISGEALKASKRETLSKTSPRWTLSPEAPW